MDEHAQVLRALDLLQEAQRLVELAGQELCPVPRSADVWTGTLRHQVPLAPRSAVERNRWLRP